MAALSFLSIATVALLILTSSAFLRLLYIHPKLRSQTKPTKSKDAQSHLLIVLGSGGHTAEMMSLLRHINPRRYTQRTYIVSSGDNFSAGKAHDIESLIQSKHNTITSKPGELDGVTGVWNVKTVPRARKIHQPLYTAPISSLWCLFGCLQVLRNAAATSRPRSGKYPDVIITNGPATAVILLLAAYVLKFVGVAPVESMNTIYVESWARVTTLSLSGKILLKLGICDRFLVQWEALAEQINGKGKDARKRVEWLGFLVE